MNAIEKILAIPDALRGMLFSEPERNGEYRFLRSYLSAGMVVFDVGANVGDHARYILSLGRVLEVHCFEPVPGTFATLRGNLAVYGDAGLKLNNFGLSDKNGEMEMFVYSENAGSNSLYFHEYHAEKAAWQYRKESANFSRLDDYVASCGIEVISFLKIDVEGHESAVIHGAKESIESGKIRCIQFEYNNYWQRSGKSLLDLMTLLQQWRTFRFYRLTPWGRLRVSPYDRTLENYKHSNYVALLA